MTSEGSGEPDVMALWPGAPMLLAKEAVSVLCASSDGAAQLVLPLHRVDAFIEQLTAAAEAAGSGRAGWVFDDGLVTDGDTAMELLAAARWADGTGPAPGTSRPPGATG